MQRKQKNQRRGFIAQLCTIDEGLRDSSGILFFNGFCAMPKKDTADSPNVVHQRSPADSPKIPGNAQKEKA